MPLHWVQGYALVKGHKGTRREPLCPKLSLGKGKRKKKKKKGRKERKERKGKEDKRGETISEHD